MGSGDDAHRDRQGGWSAGAPVRGWSSSQAGQHGGWAPPSADEPGARLLAHDGQAGRWGSEPGAGGPHGRGSAPPGAEGPASREEQLRRLDLAYQVWRRERLRVFADASDTGPA